MQRATMKRSQLSQCRARALDVHFQIRLPNRAVTHHLVRAVDFLNKAWGHVGEAVAKFFP
jgi:hypothetical protein